MVKPRTLPVFSPEELSKCHEYLATKVAFMMNRKFEEGDWAEVYCKAKNIPNNGWSNVNIDVMYQGLGVEHKMLKRETKDISELCGKTLMHPSATRSIRIPDNEDPNTVMCEIFKQYAELIEDRTQKVLDNFPNTQPEMRVGWLLWEKNLREFLYFEEEMLAPNADNYTAQWNYNTPNKKKSTRKPSKSLWVYDQATKEKKYSITTDAGIKIQPYFTIPPKNDPNLYIFHVQGEEYQDNSTRIWVTSSTANELKRLMNDSVLNDINSLIEKDKYYIKVTQEEQKEKAYPFLINTQYYKLLNNLFNGVSDERRIRQLIEYFILKSIEE